MSSTYSSVYIDLNTGKEYYLDQAIDSPYALVKYIQSQADYVWTINHNKNSDKVIVQVNGGFDLPDTQIIDGNTIQLTFSEPVAGQAILIFFDQGTVVPATPSATPTITPSVTPSVSISGSFVPQPSPSITPSITVSPTPTPSITPSSTPGTFSQPFDYALIRYIWAQPDGTDLDTRTAITTPPRNVDVGWDRANNDGAYLTWGGDNTSAVGDEAVTIAFNQLTTDYPTTDDFVIRLRGNWYGTRLDGNVQIQFQTYLGGTMQHVGTDFINVGGVLVNDASIYVNVTSNTAGNVDGSDVGTLTYVAATKNAFFTPLVPAVTTTPTPTVTQSVTVTPTLTPTRSVAPTVSVSASPVVGTSATPTPTLSPTPSQTPTFHLPPSATPTVTPTLTPNNGNAYFGRMSLAGVPDLTYSNRNLDTGANNLLATADGKMYVIGNFTTFDGHPYSYVARVNADGTTDTSFANLGLYCPDDNGLNLGIQTADGKIYLGGSALIQHSSGNYNSLIRLNSDGTFDTTFTCPDIEYQGGSGSTNALCQTADGKIYGGGWIDTINGSTHTSTYRLNSDGTLDTSFTQIAGLGTVMANVSIIQATSGLIYLGSVQYTPSPGTSKHLIRLSSSGIEDTAYGQTLADGDAVWGVNQTSDGKIYVCGTFENFNGYANLVRLNGDGTVDTTFTDVGIGDPSFVQVYGTKEVNNKIYVYGYFSTPKSNDIRLNDDGTYDSAYTLDLSDPVSSLLNYNGFIYAAGYFNGLH